MSTIYEKKTLDNDELAGLYKNKEKNDVIHAH